MAFQHELLRDGDLGEGPRVIKRRRRSIAKTAARLHRQAKPKETHEEKDACEAGGQEYWNWRNR